MLQRKYLQHEIEDKHILCLEIAGLCHDLGKLSKVLGFASVQATLAGMVWGNTCSPPPH
jgi:hypothetical protein